MNLSGADNLLKKQHSLRDGWRWWMYGKLLDQNRHDNTNLDANLDQFLKFYFPTMRGFLDGNPAFWTLLLGAARSRACFNKTDNFGFPTECIWGCGCLGSWDHVTWLCPNRPLDLHFDHPMGQTIS